MDLNDLLADIDGIGSDVFIPSTTDHALPAPTVDSAATAVIDAPSPAAHTAAEPHISAPCIDALAMVRDAEVTLRVELGTAHLPLRTVMTLTHGGDFALDTGPGHPLTIFVGEHRIGAGEALLIDGHLAIRITELLHTATT